MREFFIRMFVKRSRTRETPGLFRVEIRIHFNTVPNAIDFRTDPVEIYGRLEKSSKP